MAGYQCSYSDKPCTSTGGPTGGPSHGDPYRLPKGVNFHDDVSSLEATAGSNNSESQINPRSCVSPNAYDSDETQLLFPNQSDQLSQPMRVKASRGSKTSKRRILPSQSSLSSSMLDSDNSRQRLKRKRARGSGYCPICGITVLDKCLQEHYKAELEKLENLNKCFKRVEKTLPLHKSCALVRANIKKRAECKEVNEEKQTLYVVIQTEDREMNTDSTFLDDKGVNTEDKGVNTEEKGLNMEDKGVNTDSSREEQPHRVFFFGVDSDGELPGFHGNILDESVSALTIQPRNVEIMATSQSDTTERANEEGLTSIGDDDCLTIYGLPDTTYSRNTFGRNLPTAEDKDSDKSNTLLKWQDINEFLQNSSLQQNSALQQNSMLQENGVLQQNNIFQENSALQQNSGFQENPELQGNSEFVENMVFQENSVSRADMELLGNMDILDSDFQVDNNLQQVTDELLQNIGNIEVPSNNECMSNEYMTFRNILRKDAAERAAGRISKSLWFQQIVGT